MKDKKGRESCAREQAMRERRKERSARTREDEAFSPPPVWEKAVQNSGTAPLPYVTSHPINI